MGSQATKNWSPGALIAPQLGLQQLPGDFNRLDYGEMRWTALNLSLNRASKGRTTETPVLFDLAVRELNQSATI